MFGVEDGRDPNGIGLVFIAAETLFFGWSLFRFQFSSKCNKLKMKCFKTSGYKLVENLSLCKQSELINSLLRRMSMD